MKKKLFKIGIKLIAFLLSLNAFAQADPVITSLNPDTQELTITNIGDTQIDIGAYQLCTNNFKYDSVGSLTTESTVLGEGDSVSLSWNDIPTNGNGTLMLFASASFSSSSPDILRDFVRWGSSNFRINQGVNSTRWSSADATIECPAPYTTNGVRGGSPEGWGLVADGGTVAIDLDATGNPNGTTSFNGGTEAVICIDSLADPIVVTHTNPESASNLSYRYVITDAATGLILNVVNTDTIDLNGVAPGTCEIWGWSYRGVPGNGLDQMGQPLSSLDDLDCSDISDNQITIIREAAIGGTVAIDLDATGNPNGTTSFNGDTEAVICIDSLADPIVVTHSNPGAENLSYRYVITDAATGLILNVVNTDTIDLNGVAPGTCEIWGWSYRGVAGNGLDQVGEPLSSLDDLDCSDISDNQITIIREAAIGGTVAIDLDATGNPNGTTSFNGDTEAVICIDSLADPIVVTHSNPGAENLSYRYVITDATTGLILNVVNTDTIDLNGVAPGTCEIWGWSYRGVPGNGLDQVGEPLSSLDDLDCSDISDNQITIIREAAIGGTVAIDLDATGNPNGTTSFNGDTEAVICIDSLADPIVVTHSNPGAENLSYRYVITDAATGLILNVVNTDTIDLNGVAPGTCEIWGWSYRGVAGNGLDQVGEPLSSLDDLDCSDISDNQITIIREAAIGGTVAIDLDATGNPNGTTSFNGDTEAVICIDSLADPIVVTHSNPGAENLSYRYVITDAATGLILNVVNTDTIDLNGVAPGTCEIWGWSYRGVAGNGLDQVGEPLSSLDDLDCSDISDNQITIIREAAIGGTVAIDLDATGNPNGTTSFNGDTEAVICIDSLADPIVVTHSNPGAENLSYRYVITDAATGLILNVVNTNTIDLNGVAPGTCEIWGWSYRGVAGNGLDQVGEPLSSLDDLDCSDISDNQITIIREAAIGGTVAIDMVNTPDASGTTTITDATTATIIVEDAIANPILVTHSNPGAENLSYRYVITDAATGLILNVVNTDTIDLNGVAPGTCEIWGWSYRGVAGNGLDQVGEPLSSLDDLDCSDISDNQITVIREAAPLDSEVVLTAVNPITDELTITNIGNQPIDVANFQLCTDVRRYDAINELRGVNGAILDTDLAAGESLTLVWDEIGAENGNDNGTLILFANSNFSSSNPDDLLDYVSWGGNNFRINQAVTAGRWISADATIECPAPYETVNGRGGSPEGWGLVADGGTVAIDLDATGNPNGTTSFNGDTEAVICIDSLADPIVVTHTNPESASNLSYRYVITDAATGLILNVVNTDTIDLNGVAPGTCEIWGWSYRGVPGNGLDQMGQPLSSLDDLDCSDISDNQITIIREAAIGGTVAIDLDATGNPNGTTSFNGDTEAVICIDSLADPIVVTHSNPGAENLSYRYVITDAATGLILNVVNTDTIDLNGVAPGTCEIWGWSYRGVPGNGLDQMGQPLSSLDDLDCSDISDNQITIIREAAIGGTVAIDLDATGNPNGTTSFNGDTEAVICIDSLADPIVVTHSNPGAENLSYRYVITDAATGLILNVVNTDTIDLNGVAPGTCEIWGWSYRGVAGNGLDQVGEPLSSLDDLDCSDISDNQITIIREAAIGGTVAIDLDATGNPNGTTSFNGDTEAVICIDSLADPIVVTHSNPGAENLSYRYVITDAATGLILNVVNTDTIDLNGVAPGTCEIWGWSYRGVPGNGLDQMGQPLSSLDDLDCSDISDNQITIIREAAIGGTVAIDMVNTPDASGTTTITDATTATIIVEDAIANPIVVTHSNPGAENLSYRYVITDAATGLILNVVNTDTIDLNGVAPGTCEIWGWSYRGVAGNGLDQVGEPLSSLDDLDCSDISDNQITVIREAALAIPAQNFIVRAIGESCETSNDGSIEITAQEEFNYTAVINGVSLDNVSEEFTSEISFDNLEAGEYSVCITVAEINDFEQCFSLVVSEPQNLEVIEAFENSAKELNLQLTGGELYEINLNGEIIFTAESEITLQLSEGENNFTVKTDKDCQGIFSNKIVIEGEDTFNVVPNPVQDNLNLIFTNSSNELVSVTLYDISGKRVGTFTTTRDNEEASFNVSGLSAGIYFLNVEGTSTNVKILKK